MSLENDLVNYITNTQKKLKKQLDDDAFSIFKQDVTLVDNALAEMVIGKRGNLSQRKILRELDNFLEILNLEERGNSADQIRVSWFKNFHRLAFALTLRYVKSSKEALTDGNLIESIDCLINASYFSAVMFENQLLSEHTSFKMSGLAKSKHAHKKIKKDKAVVEYKQNRITYKSKDDAAEKLSNKYGLAFSTIRKALINV
jgi:hypothetical protein